MNIQNRLINVGESLENQLKLRIPIYSTMIVNKMYVNSSNMIQIQVR